ncbi:hypothetical protein J7337_009305 [Fusarium musae]|uniref:Uncharacterized protein n=1 Tax=Fusarium musae TaxID=1042133 RepID=A0A9P8DAS5_9HYPO|nr:hypothetical protein J7337_009305 [Fusarium musae]KAG9498498.1 hypothetical protein J7337_009305 [Fusarium musae]
MSSFVDSARKDAEIGLKRDKPSLMILELMLPEALLEQATKTFSREDMDNIRKIGRLMERVEVLEAENRALKKKNTEFKDKQAKMVKLLTDE